MCYFCSNLWYFVDSVFHGLTVSVQDWSFHECFMINVSWWTDVVLFTVLFQTALICDCIHPLKNFRQLQWKQNLSNCPSINTRKVSPVWQMAVIAYWRAECSNWFLRSSTKVRMSSTSTSWPRVRGRRESASTVNEIFVLYRQDQREERVCVCVWAISGGEKLFQMTLSNLDFWVCLYRSYRKNNTTTIITTTKVQNGH